MPASGLAMGSGAPLIADDLAASVARMVRIGACWSPALSPDGSRLAFVSNLNGNPQVWMVPTEGGWPDLVTALDDPIDSVTWSPDGAWLAFALAPGGGMNQQVYLVRPDGTGLRRLTDGGKENNDLGRWILDGRGLVISSSRRDPKAKDAYIFDLASSEMRLAASNPGIATLTDVSRDGRLAVLWRMVNRGDSNLYAIDLATGREVLLTPHEGPGSFGGGRFSHDGRTVYVRSNQGRELIAFARVRLGDDGPPGPIEVLAARDDAELSGLAVSRDGTIAALLWNVAGRSDVDFVDITTLKITPGPDLPAEIVTGINFSNDTRLVAISMMGATTPQDIWVFDRSSGRLSQVTHSPHAGVDLAALVRPELVRFRAHDGLDLSGWLYRPPEGAPGPVVLSFHGGPESQERPLFNSLYQALLAQGMAVFAPNVRGSSGFGKTFANLDNGPLRVNAVRDIKASVDYVIDAGVARSGQIGIMGASYGGYMTMAGLTEYPDLFAAGASICGVVNFETFFAHTEPWMAAISKIEYGDPETQMDLLRSLSPLHKIERVKAPTIVLHGANDTNVPVVEAEQVVENLKRRGVPVEYVLFPDEGHGFRKTANRIHATVAIARWFATHLIDARR